MRVLIDTHVFIWMDEGASDQFSEECARVLADRGTILLLSHASVWEMAIKVGIGKLAFRQPLGDLVAEYVEQGILELLPIALPHVLAVEGLPFHHRDPFDRLILAQALTEQLPLMSADAVFTQYGVRRVWN